MLSRKKLSSKGANQWCVILNPISSELIKTETIDKIVDIFPLSIEEAAQLVERTPIILLENLSYNQAKKVKDLMADVEAEVLLTDDTFLRRKCYRTVWQQDPLQKVSLERINIKRQMVQDEVLMQQKLSKQSAIQDIRDERHEDYSHLRGGEASVVKSKQNTPQAEAITKSENNEKKHLLDQVEQLKKQIFELRHEVNLKEQTNNEFEYLSVELEKAKESLLEKDILNKKLANELEQAKQSAAAETAKNEERKTLQQELNFELHEKEGKTQKNALKENEHLKGLLQDLQQDNEVLRKEHESYIELQNKYEYLEKEIRDFAAKRSLYEEIEEKYARLNSKYEQQEKENLVLNDKLSAKEREIANLLNEVDEREVYVDSTKAQLNNEVLMLKNEIALKKETIDRLELEKGQLKTLIDNIKRDNEELRESALHYEGLENKYLYLEEELKEFAKAKVMLEDFEMKCNDLQQIVAKQKKENADFKTQLLLVQEQAQNLDTTVREKEAEIKRYAAQIETLSQDIAEKENLLVNIKNQKDQLKNLVEEVQRDNDNLREVKAMYGDLEEKYSYLEGKLTEVTKAKEQLQNIEEQYAKQSEECKDLKSNITLLREKLDETLEEKERLDKIESLYNEKVAESEKNKNYIESQSEQIAELEKMISELRDTSSRVKADYDKYRDNKERVINEQDMLLAEQKRKIDELESKCKALIDHNERQEDIIRDLTIRREEQEERERRIVLQQKIAEKEMKLRALIKEEDSFKHEIVEHEKLIGNIMAQQEAIEKELIKMNQEQKHIIEKSKIREKQRHGKPSSRVNIISPENNAHEEVSVKQ